MRVRRLVAAAGLAVACTAALGAPSASAAPMFANLDGQQEVPPSGSGGTGAALINIEPWAERACIAERHAGIDQPIAMHIHQAPPGLNGPVVVNFSTTLDGGCVSAPEATLRAIRQDPGEFYLNVHTPNHPAGAIRGQLDSSLVGSWRPTGSTRTRKFARMTGAQETGPQDPDARGAALVNVRPKHGKVCIAERYANIAPPDLMHIHRGAAGVAGPIVIDLTSLLSSGRCVAADPALLKEVRDSPADFYCNIHNAPYPAGAMRGQLETRG